MRRLRLWLRRPRDLMILFLLVLLAPAVALTVLGWRSLEQDKVLHLANPEGWGLTEDALCVVFRPHQIDVEPPGCLLYYPALPRMREAPDRLFRQAEQFES
jgi:hypothetical protein